MSSGESGQEATKTRWEAALRQPSIWHYIAVLPVWFAALTLFALMSMTFLDVILRSTINNPIESATELTRLFMAIIVFSALPMVSWKGGNIVVDLLDPFFGKTLSRLRDIAIDLICGAALLLPAKRVFDLAERARSYGDVTEYLHMPQHYIGWYISVFAFLTALTFLARGIVRLIAPHRLEAA